MRQNQDLPELLTPTEAAELLMVEPRQIRKLAQLGYIERTDAGRYPKVSVVQGYIRWLKEDRSTDENVRSRNAVTLARTRDLEVSTDRRAERLGDVDELEETLDEILGETRKAFASQPFDKVVRDPAIRRKMTSAIDAVFDRVVAKKTRMIAELRRTGKARDPHAARH